MNMCRSEYMELGDVGQPANDPGWGAIYRNRIYNYIHAHVVSTEVVITEPGCGCGFESFSLVFIDFMYYACISYYVDST